MEPVKLEWHLDVAASQRRTWAIFGDTDRFNRAARLGFEFEEEPLDDGTVRRTGMLRKFGLTIRWVEAVFDFQAPHGFYNVRRFLDGPVSRLEVSLAVTPTDAGSHVHYTVQLTPRNWLMIPVVHADARFTTGPLLDKTLRGAKDLAEGRDTAFDPPPPELDQQLLTRLLERTDPILPHVVGQELARTIASAPIAEQARIQPLALAERLDITPDQAVHGCLEAVRRGVLELTWDLMCPSCQGAKKSKTTLDLVDGEVHCPSCNIRFDPNFADAVEVVFQPSSDIRAVDVPLDCALAPSRTPHVLARERVEPGGDVAWSLEVVPGGYLLDSMPSRGGVVVRVYEGAHGSEATIDWTDSGPVPSVIELAPGPVRIFARSRRRDAVELTMRERWQPQHALTAGRLLAMEGVGDLLQPAAIAPGVRWAVQRGVVVAVEQSEGSSTKITGVHTKWEQMGMQLSYSGSSSIIAVWATVRQALEAVDRLAGDREIGVGIAVGPVTRIERQDATFPMGPSVDRALKVMRDVGTGNVGIDEAALGDPEVDEGLQNLGDRVRLRPVIDAGHTELRFASAVLRRKAEREAAALYAPTAPSQVGGRFRVQKLLGKGGQGMVYEVLDTATDETCVIKVLRPEVATDPVATQRFHNEARISASLDHPNIVAVRDWGQDGAGLWLAMEKLDGEELHDELDRRGTIDPERLRWIARQVLSALAAAHDAGVVHRDVKPENIFLIGDEMRPQVKVIDFGIAVEAGELDEAAESGMLIGTLGYVSPEQVQLESLDGRSDLYSFGIVLYRCLTGRLPFKASTPMGTVMMRLRSEASPVQQLAPMVVPPDLVTAVERSMVVDRDERFQTAAEMAAVLSD